MNKQKTRPGWITVEFIVSLMLVWMILAVLATAMNTSRKFTHYHHANAQCLAAARSQLSSLTATGEPISDTDIERLWKGVTVTVQQTQGTDQWTGLELLKVTAAKKFKTKNITVELTKYIDPKVK